MTIKTWSIASASRLTTASLLAAASLLTTATTSLAFTPVENQDYFLKNVWVLLAESRSKTVVTRPDALCECSKTP